MGHRRRRPARQAPRDARLLPDHAGVGHPPRAVQAQALRRAHRAGRGRDRRRRHGARRRLRRPPRRHHHERPRPDAQERDDLARRVARAAAARSSTSSAAARRPACRPRPRPPTSTSPCSAATARRRCRSSPPTSPVHCFDAAIEAIRIALKYRTPVILLSDGYLANGSEPWRLPDVDVAARHLGALRHRAEPHQRRRRPRVLALPPRPRHAGPPVGDPRHAGPDAPHRRHREGGRHRQHQLHAGQPPAHGRPPCGQGGRHRQGHPTARRSSATPTPSCCIVGWGSTWAAIDAAVQRRRRSGRKVAWVHLTHLNPLPSDLGDIVRRFPKVLVPELNTGQLARLIRADYLVDAQLAEQDRRVCRSRPARSRPRIEEELQTPDDRHRRRPRHHARRTGRATRRCAGAPVAATTASSSPSSS